MSRRGPMIISGAALVILGLIVHGTALAGWWLYDDPQLLTEAIQQPVQAVLFNPAEYTHLAAHTFTPLLLLSFKADLFLHGLDPRVFYAHQLIALVAAALLLYFLLRRYVPELYAAAGSAVFLTSWASVYAARTLMVRHYVEGLVFALAALLAWSFGRRLRIIGAVLYLLAMLSKEVYAPIPLFLICQQRYEGRSWRDIARDLISPTAALLVFLLWRWHMTGLRGTYAASPGASDLTESHALWGHLVGPASRWPSITWAAALVIAFASFLFEHRLDALRFLAAVATIIALPILPLTTTYFQWRYSFAFVTFIILAFTIAAGMARPFQGTTAVLLLLTTTMIMSIAQRRYYRQLTRRGIEQEGHYVWDEPTNAPVLAATSPEWYLGGLAWLRRHENRGDGPRVIFSRYAITTGAVDPRYVVAIDPSRHPVPLQGTNLFGTPAEWQRTRQRYDPSAPLAIDFSLRHHDAHWRLGPPGGRFIFLTDPGYSAISIPPLGSQRVPGARERQFFRIVREEENGRWTVSPTLPVPADGSSTVFQR